MEKIKLYSSRFISLSGLSGVFVGLCGLLGTYFTYQIVYANYTNEESTLREILSSYDHYSIMLHQYTGEKLMFLGIFTLVLAFIAAFVCTNRVSRKERKTIWDNLVQKQVKSLVLMFVVSTVFELKIVDTANYGLIIPTSLIFYGISLVIVSNYTSGFVKYLGYAELLLGLVNLWFIRWGIYFLGIGFGVLHIAYGITTFVLNDQFNLDFIRPEGKDKW